MRNLTAKERAYLAGSVILVDTREQRPLTFQRPTRSCGLDCGDYSVEGPDSRSFAPGNKHSISIERKSLDDLVASFAQGRGRFEREFERAQDLEYFALVVEASLADITAGHYTGGMTPAAVVQSLVSWSVRFKVPVWFADDRRHSARLVESLLEKHVRRLLVESELQILATEGHEGPQEARKGLAPG